MLPEKSLLMDNERGNLSMEWERRSLRSHRREIIHVDEDMEIATPFVT
jgi:hypothetical protein